MRRFAFAATLFSLSSLAPRAGAQNKPRQELKEITPDKVDTAVYQRLKYRYIGPEGNRVTSVTGVAGDPNMILRRRCVRGALEVHRRRHSLVTDLRRAAGVVGRRAGGRAERSERRLGRHRRAVHPQPHLGRLGRVQVDRRREDVDAMRSREHRPHLARRRDPANPDLVYAPRSASPTDRSPRRGIYRTTDGGKTLGEGAVRQRFHRRHRTS